MTDCPTPSKIAYRNRGAATAAAIRYSRELGPLRTYRCPCKAWHLTTKRRPNRWRAA